MNDDYLRPSQKDIDLAIKYENAVKPEQMAFYLDCMNNLPMSQRKTNRELRDGCILTHGVYIFCWNGQNPKNKIEKL